AHQPRRFSAAGERLVLAAKLGEVRPGPRAVLEETRLARPQVHDPAGVDQVVVDGLDETRMRLRTGVSVLALEDFAAAGVAEIVALGRAGDAIGPVQARVEPLRAVGGAHLVQ